MIKALFAPLLAELVMTALASPVYGWDSLGHMMVAYVACQDLTPEMKTRANALVRMNPKHSEWAR